MSSEQDYSLELMFSGVNENSKFVKINNAKLESHSYQMDYAGVLSAQYAFNFECNEATGMAVKWGQETGHSTGILFSFENLQLRSSDGSGLYCESPPPLSYTYDLSYSSVSSDNACTAGGAVRYYSPSASLVVGSILYQDIYLTNPVSIGYYSYNNNYYAVLGSEGSVGEINSDGGCPPPFSIIFTMNFNSSVTTNCTNSNNFINAYTESLSLGLETVLFQDPYLSIPIPSRRYLESDFLYDVVNGVVTNIFAECFPEPSVGSFTFSLETSSGPSVNIDWSSAENATGYAIFKSEDDVSFSQIYNANSAPPYNDSNVLGGGAGTPNYYYYYMTAISGASSYTTATQLIGVE
jgi:hypothetical protein